MVQRGRLRTATAIIIGGVMVLGPATSAYGDDFGDLDGGATTTTYTADQIIAAANASEGTAEAQAAKAAFIAEQSSWGREVDASEITAAVLGDTDVVWDNALSVQQVSLDLAKPDESGSPLEGVGVLAGFAGSDDEDKAAAAAPVEIVPDVETSGTGTQATGGTWLSGYCVSTITTGGTATTCFSKYKLSRSTSTRDYYYYQRKVTATGKDLTGFDYVPTKIDARSRPWAGSDEVASLVDYWQWSGQRLCDEGASFTYNFSNFFSIQAPILDCTDISPIPSGLRMGVVLDQGTFFSGRSHGVTFGMVMSAFQNRGAIRMADYTYVKFCRATYATCNVNLRTDSGW